MFTPLRHNINFYYWGTQSPFLGPILPAASRLSGSSPITIGPQTPCMPLGPTGPTCPLLLPVHLLNHASQHFPIFPLVLLLHLFLLSVQMVQHHLSPSTPVPSDGPISPLTPFRPCGLMGPAPPVAPRLPDYQLYLILL